MKMHQEDLQQIYRAASNQFDLTESSHQISLLELADSLLDLKHTSPAQLASLAQREDCPLAFKLAVKLVQSRKYLRQITTPISIGVVFAMWGEHHRLLEKSAANINGENSLLTKVTQLQWACKGTKVDWHLYPVDDGCPHSSFDIANRIADRSSQPEKISVLDLKDGISAKQGPLAKLNDVDDSRKGGAIIHGCMQALSDGVDAVIYTDADNSVHMGQLGLILAPFVANHAQVVLGNRKDPLSILVKQEQRWGIGIKTLRHMQRMVGSAVFSKGIHDTQAAYKLFSRDALQHILAKPSVFDFSFDTDWILAAMQHQQSIASVPFAFIDSAAESASITQGPMSTWLTLLQGLVKALRAREADYNKEMAQLIDKEIQTAEDLERIINLLPDELVHAKDAELGDIQLMSPKALATWLTKVKAEQLTATA
ncbi:glycosyltransferase [Shewanella abyssi]|uniref:glycosyltransferase n=1 Tax=Shewanella abyssi TaxID=311789 RepID=UPI00200BF550|nr:glycosyltransferase [Shewanella abyssi]MCL1049290.1 glycosyltransferase [Shewanella abyssi]MCL1049331.1 glycosyltransferase [Shewanella abyssi]